MPPTPFSWSSAVEVGVPGIDAQHKQLFDLAASFAGDGDQIRVMKTLAILCDYARTHLLEEEALLEAVGYPDLARHREHHAQFRVMLNELLDEARAMTLDQIAERVEALINGWFYQHILRVDAAYVPFLREAGKDAEAHGSA